MGHRSFGGTAHRRHEDRINLNTFGKRDIRFDPLRVGRNLPCLCGVER